MFVWSYWRLPYYQISALILDIKNFKIQKKKKEVVGDAPALEQKNQGSETSSVSSVGLWYFVRTCDLTQSLKASSSFRTCQWGGPLYRAVGEIKTG